MSNEALLNPGRRPKASLGFGVVISAIWIQPVTDVGTNCGVIWGFRPSI